nr:T9SS type A sorting domain-containing protein [Bacteroidia bacterium]
NFSSAALEFDIFENGAYQECIFSVAGSQFGTNFNSSTTGCLQPPCATIDIAVPDTFLFAQSFVFNWQTTTSHLNTFGWNPAKTYYFLFRATDNYCPVNGSKARIVSITVVDSTVGVESLNTQVQIKIFPNPAKDGIYSVNFKNVKDENFPVTISNINGQTITHKHFNYFKEESKGILDLSSQPSGIYILRIGDSVSRIVKL